MEAATARRGAARLAPALLVAACAAPPSPPPQAAAVQGPACSCARLEGTLAGPSAAAEARLLAHVEAGLARALAQQGCAVSAQAAAPWRLRYELRVDAREQVLQEGGALLQPRLACDATGCRVRQDWIHQGPPRYAPPRRVLREARLRLQLRAANSAQSQWQGRTTRVLPAAGGQAAHTVAVAASDLAGLLPRLRGSDTCDTR